MSVKRIVLRPGTYAVLEVNPVAGLEQIGDVAWSATENLQLNVYETAGTRVAAVLFKDGGPGSVTAVITVAPAAGENTGGAEYQETHVFEVEDLAHSRADVTHITN